MATEAHILSDETVEPACAPVAAPGTAAASTDACPGITARLRSTAFGRLVHSCLQWAVVLSLITSGYFGAELISTGVEMATRSHGPGTGQILATSSHGN